MPQSAPDPGRAAGVAADRDLALMPSATATAPPESSRRARAHGSNGFPGCRNADWRRRRRTQTHSCWSLRRSPHPPRAGAARSAVGCGHQAFIVEHARPARVTSPATSNRSLMLTIAPSSGPSGRPSRNRASAAPASVARPFPVTVRQARAPSPAGSRCARAAVRAGRGEGLAMGFPCNVNTRYRSWRRPHGARSPRLDRQDRLDSECLGWCDVVVSHDSERQRATTGTAATADIHMSGVNITTERGAPPQAAQCHVDCRIWWTAPASRR